MRLHVTEDDQEVLHKRMESPVRAPVLYAQHCFLSGLLKMFQNLLNLHREFAFDKVLLSERRITESFQYRPSVLPNIQKLRLPKPPSLSSSSSMHSVISNTERHRLVFSPTPTPRTRLPTPVHSTSFSKRADIETFQHKQESLPLKSTQKPISPIESNEIDLTKLVRETNPNHPCVSRLRSL